MTAQHTTMTAHGPDGPDGPSVPWIVAAVTALPAGLTFAIAVLLAVIAAVTAEVQAARTAATAFSGTIGLLSGQQIGGAGELGMFGAGGGGAVVMPFGMLFLTAMVLCWLPLSRAWLDRPRGWIRPAVAAVASLLVLVLLGKIVSSFATIDEGFGRVALTYNLRLVVPVLAAAAIWPTAAVLTRRRDAMRMAHVLLILIGIVVALGLLAGLVDGASNGNILDGLVSGVPFAIIAMLYYGLNVVAAAVQWPFAVPISFTNPDNGMFVEQLTFSDATSLSGGYWLVPVVVIAAMFLAGYLTPAASSWDDLIVRTRNFALGGLLLVVPAATFGDITASFDVGLFGNGFAQQFEAGLTGQPWRAVVPLAVWSLFYAVGIWLSSQQYGHHWARPSELHTLGGSLAGASSGLVASVKALADRAREQAQDLPRPPQGPQRSSPAAAPASAPSPFVASDPEPQPVTVEQVQQEAADLGVTDQLGAIAQKIGATTMADTHDPAKMQAMLDEVRRAAAAETPAPWTTQPEPTPRPGVDDRPPSP